MIDLVTNAFFVIVPSEWYENNPMTIIEAYSVGTPVIGAKIGGIPEIVINKKTGFQFESANPENLIEQILVANSLSEKQYTEFSYQAIQFAKTNFSLDNYYPKLIEFYRKFHNK